MWSQPRSRPRYSSQPNVRPGDLHEVLVSYSSSHQPLSVIPNSINCHSIHNQILNYYFSNYQSIQISMDDLRSEHVLGHWEGAASKSQFFGISPGSPLLHSIVTSVIKHPSKISINSNSGHVLVSGVINRIIGHKPDDVTAMQVIQVVLNSSQKFITCYPTRFL